MKLKTHEFKEGDRVVIRCVGGEILHGTFLEHSVFIGWVKVAVYGQGLAGRQVRTHFATEQIFPYLEVTKAAATATRTLSINTTSENAEIKIKSR